MLKLINLIYERYTIKPVISDVLNVCRDETDLMCNIYQAETYTSC